MEGVAARVAGIEISMSRFEAAVELAGEELFKELLEGTEEAGTLEAIYRERDENLIKSTVLQQLIDGVLIEEGAKREGITVTNKDIRNKIEELKKKFPSSLDFHRSIAEQGMTVEDLKKNIHRQLVVEGLRELLMGRIVVSDEEIKSFYDRNIGIFVQPKRVAVQHILVKEEELAEKIIASLDAGANFEELAKVYSMDTKSRDRGGNLRFVERGELAPELEEIAFILKPGSVSPIIESDDGFYILKVTERVAGKETTPEQAKENIRDFLLKEKGFAAFSKWLEDQRFLTEIVINEKLKDLIESEQTSSYPRLSFDYDLT